MTQPLFRDKYRVKASRLPNRNYGANGYYFVIICTRDRLHFFGNIVETLQCNVSLPTSAPRKDPQRKFMSQISRLGRSLGTIMRAHKSIVTHCCRQNGLDNFGWQPRFYEHIIRADGSLERICQYIHDNPANWAKESNNCPNLWM